MRRLWHNILYNATYCFNSWSFTVKTPWRWPKRAETCRRIGIYNKYTKSAFVGSYYLHLVFTSLLYCHVLYIFVLDVWYTVVLNVFLLFVVYILQLFLLFDMFHIHTFVTGSEFVKCKSMYVRTYVQSYLILTVTCLWKLLMWGKSNIILYRATVRYNYRGQ